MGTTTWNELTPEEQALFAVAKRKRAYARNAAERDVMRKYWAARKAASRAGLTAAERDARRNVDYRAWLVERGWSPNRFNRTLYRRWLAEGRPQ